MSSVAGESPVPSIRYIENKNQWPCEVLFAAEVNSGRMALMQDRFRFYFFGERKDHFEKNQANYDPSSLHLHEDGSHHRKAKKDGHMYEVRFAGARSDARVSGEEAHGTLYNYLLGSDRSKWGQKARAYGRVVYKNIYDGIDLYIFSQGKSVKYEWHVAMGADPSQVAMIYEGVGEPGMKGDDLVIRTTVNEVTELRPFAYQVVDGRQVVVPCFFRIEGKKVTYQFPSGYDPCYDLVIDPILIFSAYSGSTLDNWGNTAAYDRHGNVYSGGMVENPGGIKGFPSTPGVFQVNSAGGDWDVGILKYDSAGTHLLYATYLGGSNTETPQSLVVNNKDELLILGATGSSNFPVTNGTAFRGGQAIDPLGAVEYDFGTDIFVAKLSEDGSDLLGATFLGGTNNDGVNFVSGNILTPFKTESTLARNYGDQLRGDIIIDEDDFVYIASNTRSSNFTGTTNTFGGAHDAVIVKLTADLTAISTARYVGGLGTDAAYSIKLHGGKVYVAGGTDSNNFPVNSVPGLRTTKSGSNNIDGWVASFSANDFTMINGTFLGTTSYDQAYFIDLNAEGEVYVFGQTRGSYPVVGNVYRNTNAGQFIHKLSSDLMTTRFSTVVGSSSNGVINPNISPTAFLVSECNNLYLSGWGGRTNATSIQVNFNGVPTVLTRNYVGGTTDNMPVTADAYQHTTAGDDFYMMVLSADASEFLYGTYLGGDNSAVHVDGGTSRFDKQGIVYHAVCAGCGGNSDFPAVNVPVQHRTNNSENCNNAVFKFDLSLLRARIQTNTVKLSNPGIQRICLPDRYVFENNSTGGKVFHWSFGDGALRSTTSRDTVSHAYAHPGTYTVTLTAIDEGTCKVIDVTSTVVTVFKPQAVMPTEDDVCEGSQHRLVASGGAFYEWRASDKSVVSSQASVLVSPKDTTDYYVSVIDIHGCKVEDTVRLNVVPKINPQFRFRTLADCVTRPAVSVEDKTDSLQAEDILFFDFGDGTTSDNPATIHNYSSDGVYRLKLTTSRHGCVYEQVQDIPIFKVMVPNVITPGGTGGLNDVFTIRYGDSEGVTPSQYGKKTSVVIYNRWGNVLFETDDYQYDWSGEGLSSGVYYYEVTIEGYSTCKSWIQLVK